MQLLTQGHKARKQWEPGFWSQHLFDSWVHSLIIMLCPALPSAASLIEGCPDLNWTLSWAQWRGGAPYTLRSICQSLPSIQMYFLQMCWELQHTADPSRKDAFLTPVTHLSCHPRADRNSILSLFCLDLLKKNLPFLSHHVLSTYLSHARHYAKRVPCIQSFNS